MTIGIDINVGAGPGNRHSRGAMARPPREHRGLHLYPFWRIDTARVARQAEERRPSQKRPLAADNVTQLSRCRNGDEPAAVCELGCGGVQIGSGRQLANGLRVWFRRLTCEKAA